MSGYHGQEARTNEPWWRSKPPRRCILTASAATCMLATATREPDGAHAKFIIDTSCDDPVTTVDFPRTSEGLVIGYDQIVQQIMHHEEAALSAPAGINTIHDAFALLLRRSINLSRISGQGMTLQDAEAMQRHFNTGITE